MPLPDLSKTQRRIVTIGGVLVGCTLCPALIAPLASVPGLAAITSALTAIFSMGGAVAGGIVATDLVQNHSSHIATRLRNADEKLANHDLTHAVGLAIALIIQSFAEADIYPQYKKDLEALAKTAVKAWLNIAEATKGTRDDDFAQIQDEEISALFSQKSEEFFKQPVLTLDAWKSLVQDWLSREANRHLREDVVEALAKQLHTKFTLALREVLKEDFESGGKAFASLTLSMLGEINATLREQQQRIRNYQDNNSQPSQDINQLTADFQIAIQQVETLSQQLSGINSSVEEIKVKAQQNFQQLGNQINSGFADVLCEMGLFEIRISDLLREVQATTEVILDEVQQLRNEEAERDRISLQQYEELVRLIEQIDTRKTAEGGSISFSEPLPTTAHWQGRIEEIQQLTAWLNDDNNQFIGIVGLGGVGKSTLAAKLYTETPGFEGKFWADVSQKPSFSVLARRILMEFGKYPEIVEQIEESRLVEVVVNCLRERRFLLVIDNLETLLPAGSGWQDSDYKKFFTRWIDCAGKSEVLVTSQEIPADLNHTNPCWVELKGIKPDEGMALLKSLGIQGTDTELREFVEKVAGYPLLLKLVAGFLKDEVGKNAKITDLKDFGLADLSLLMADERIKGRHRQEMVQVVVVLDASFNRLSDKLQQLLLALSVYRQSFDVTAANALIDEEVSVQDLRDLAKRSLLQEERINGEWRFKFQPFIAAYARQKAGDLTEVNKRAIAYYDSRKKIKQEWQTLEDVREYLEIFYHWCELEEYAKAFDTIRGGSYDECVEIFLDLRGYNQVLVELFDRLVQNWQQQDREDWQFCACLTSLGIAYDSLGEYQKAIRFHHQSLEIKRKIGDSQSEANSLGNLGNTYYSLGEYQQAIQFHYQSLEISRQIGDSKCETGSLNNLGRTYNSLKEYQQAVKLLQQSLEISRQIHDRRGEANSIGNLGVAYYCLGEYQQAVKLLQQSLEISLEIGDLQGEANSYNNLGNTYYSLGEYQQAIQFHQQCLKIKQEIGDRKSEALSLGNLATVYHSIKEYRQAIQLDQQCLKIKREIGDRRGEACYLNNLGNTYYSLGEYQQAIHFHQQSLEIKREIGDREGEGSSLNNLGNACQLTGQFEQAIECYQQLLQIKRESNDRGDEANYHQILSRLYFQTGKIKEGCAAHFQASQILSEIWTFPDDYPLPNWMKSAIKFAQRGKWQIALCFVAGLIAFPLVPFIIVAFVALIVWRIIRAKLRGH